jgi:hypothetical protein
MGNFWNVGESMSIYTFASAGPMEKAETLMRRRSAARKVRLLFKFKYILSRNPAARVIKAHALQAAP